MKLSKKQERFIRKVNKLDTCTLLVWYMDVLSQPDDWDCSWSSSFAAWQADYVEEELKKRVGRLEKLRKAVVDRIKKHQQERRL